jgi:hypothetical protein
LLVLRAWDLLRRLQEGGAMSLVRLLGFKNLTCGCVVGRYRDLASGRELTYVEEKGPTCETHSHRRNHTVANLNPPASPTLIDARAS